MLSITMIDYVKILDKIPYSNKNVIGKELY